MEFPTFNIEISTTKKIIIISKIKSAPNITRIILWTKVVMFENREQFIKRFDDKRIWIFFFHSNVKRILSAKINVKDVEINHTGRKIAKTVKMLCLRRHFLYAGHAGTLEFDKFSGDQCEQFPQTLKVPPEPSPYIMCSYADCLLYDANKPLCAWIHARDWKTDSNWRPRWTFKRGGLGRARLSKARGLRKQRKRRKITAKLCTFSDGAARHFRHCRPYIKRFIEFLTLKRTDKKNSDINNKKQLFNLTIVVKNCIFFFFYTNRKSNITILKLYLTIYLSSLRGHDTLVI